MAFSLSVWTPRRVGSKDRYGGHGSHLISLCLLWAMLVVSVASWGPQGLMGHLRQSLWKDRTGGLAVRAGDTGDLHDPTYCFHVGTPCVMSVSDTWELGVLFCVHLKGKLPACTSQNPFLTPFPKTICA